MNEMAAAYLGLALLAVVVLVLWVLLPFAVFGVKPLLREMLHEQRVHNQLLRERNELERAPR